MTVLFTERVAIEKHLQWIKEERERLNGEYLMVINRLKEIDKEQGVFSIKNPDEVIENLVELLRTKQLTSSDEISAIDFINMQNEDLLKENDINKTKVIDRTIDNKREYQILKDKEKKRSTRNDANYLSKKLKTLIKQNNNRMTTKEIKRALQDDLFKVTNFTMLLNQIMKADPSIIRVSRGKYSVKT